MSDLIESHAEARSWIDRVKEEHSRQNIYGEIIGGVIWSDSTGPDGELIVPVDPLQIVEKINANGLRLLKEHDPGFPLGQVLAAANFTSSSGARFVTAVFGLYGGRHISFRDLPLSSDEVIASPATLPPLG
jgi:hypothetical protein